MNTEVLGVIAQIVLLIVLSYPLGKYIAKVYKGEKTWPGKFVPVHSYTKRHAGAEHGSKCLSSGRLTSEADTDECTVIIPNSRFTDYRVSIASQSKIFTFTGYRI